MEYLRNLRTTSNLFTASLRYFAMRFRIIPGLLLILSALCCFTLGVASASPAKQLYRVGQVLGDGNSGNVYRQWQQQIDEANVAKVVAEVKRVRGGSDTFINLRYGNGQAFENGKQVFLPDGNYRTVTWNVNQAPGGQPLVLNAYKGEVLVRNVVVTYAGGRTTSSIGSGKRRPDYRDKRDKYRNYDHRNRDYRDRDYRDDYRDRYSNNRGGSSIDRICRRGNYRQPRIEIEEFRPSGGLFSGKYRINGSVFGACVEEAGYFERGRLKQNFNFPYNDRFKRKSFSLQIRTGRNGEIRVYTSDGSEDFVRVDDLLRNNQRRGQGQQQPGGLLGGVLN